MAVILQSLTSSSYQTNSLLFPQRATSLYTQPSHYTSWSYVRSRFRSFLENLQLTEPQISDGLCKTQGITSCLNRAYRNLSSRGDYSLIVGSWGKGTQCRPPRDIDLMFVLPPEVYYRFEQRVGNRQAQLLQEVKNILLETYPSTGMRGDGQVVVIPFISYAVELIPAFQLPDGGYLICDTNNGGRYKWIVPQHEAYVLRSNNTHRNGNVVKLTQMLKQWQLHCNVPIKSFHIENLIMDMLSQSKYGGLDEYWFDWLIRDFFQYMVWQTNRIFYMPTTNEPILLGDSWLSRAQTAYERANRACSYEFCNNEQMAGDEWQKIFGPMIPKMI